MARCGCGGAGCNCTVVAGENVSVTGTGATGTPYTISAEAPPAALITVDSSCIELSGDGSAGSPLTADPVLDPVAGNQLVCGAAGLLVPAAAGGGTVETGCGLSGDGSVGAPVVAGVSAWPYACDLDVEGGLVYCDSDGLLRTEPKGRTYFVEDGVNTSYPATAVPTGSQVLVEARTLTLVNPDACRPMFVIVEVELDVDFRLPVGGGASSSIGSNAVQYFENRGTVVNTDAIHQTSTFVYNRMVAPGASLVETTNVRMGQGKAGATYSRIETYMRAFGIVV